MKTKFIAQSVDKWLHDVDYESLNDTSNYIPSSFAIQFINFIKLVNGAEGESNETPVVHMKMLDNLAGPESRLANLCHRGMGKTAVFCEYLVLYIGVYGEIPGFGSIEGMIYVTDSMENGAKSARKNIEHRYEGSEFLKKYLPTAKFTDPMLEFVNADGHKTAVRMFGAKTGLRGTKIYGKRPTLAILDDLVSDSDADSPTIMRAIKNTVYKGVDYALDPMKRKIVFSGTPFNKGDILYEAVESGAWKVNVYPVCEKFPCTREEFKGSWPDRFTYDYVYEQHQSAVATGELASFMQELMLKITNDEDLLVLRSDLRWYNRKDLLQRMDNFNFYITTDFATSEKASADYSVISVWAYNNNADWFLVDGVCARQDMGTTIDDLFRLAQMYSPILTGIEVTGQQGGFIPWIKREMMVRNIWFTLASDGNSNKPGIRPNTNKLVRFNTFLPQIKMGKLYIPEGMEDHPLIAEMLEEILNISKTGFKSKHDDAVDTVSMLTCITPWKPSVMTGTAKVTDGIWGFEEEDETNNIDSYIV